MEPRPDHRTDPFGPEAVQLYNSCLEGIDADDPVAVMKALGIRKPVVASLLDVGSKAGALSQSLFENCGEVERNSPST